jgi:hypothetical protein
MRNAAGTRRSPPSTASTLAEGGRQPEAGSSPEPPRRRARDERSHWAGGSDVEPRRTGMVRREVRGDVEDRGVQDPSRCSIGYRVRRMPQSCRLNLWTRVFGPSPIRVQEARAGSPYGEVNSHLGNPGLYVRAAGDTRPPGGITTLEWALCPRANRGGASSCRRMTSVL